MLQKVKSHERTPGSYLEHQQIQFIPSPKRVRAFIGGETIVDSRHAMLLRERGHPPVYYFPKEDVRMDLLVATDHHTTCPYKGQAAYWSIRIDNTEIENAVWSYPDPNSEALDIAGYLAFYWNKVDTWYEEDEEVFVHPHDPYHRIDVSHSSRHIRVVVAGETVAETQRPVLLFETGLPIRFYIPKIDTRFDKLITSDTVTYCPYKGEAHYFSAKSGTQVVKDIAWYYPYPVTEVAKIANLVCFYNERVEAFYVDDELQAKS